MFLNINLQQIKMNSGRQHRAEVCRFENNQLFRKEEHYSALFPTDTDLFNSKKGQG